MQYCRWQSLAPPTEKDHNMPRYSLTEDNHNRFSGLTQRRIERGLPVGPIITEPTIVIETSDLLPWWAYVEASTVAAVDEARRKGLI